MCASNSLVGTCEIQIKGRPEKRAISMEMTCAIEASLRDQCMGCRKLGFLRTLFSGLCSKTVAGCAWRMAGGRARNVHCRPQRVLLTLERLGVSHQLGQSGAIS